MAQGRVGDNVFNAPTGTEGSALIKGANTFINFFFFFLYVVSFFILGMAWLKYKEENYKDALKALGAAMGIAVTVTLLRFVFKIGAEAGGGSFGF